MGRKWRRRKGKRGNRKRKKGGWIEREEARKGRIEEVKKGEKEGGERKARWLWASDLPWVSRANINVNK